MEHKYDQAVEALKQATTINPKSEWPWRVMGIAYKDRRDYDKALEMFGKANEVELQMVVRWKLRTCSR